MFPKFISSIVVWFDDTSTWKYRQGGGTFKEMLFQWQQHLHIAPGRRCLSTLLVMTAAHEICVYHVNSTRKYHQCRGNFQNRVSGPYSHSLASGPGFQTVRNHFCVLHPHLGSSTNSASAPWHPTSIALPHTSLDQFRLFYPCVFLLHGHCNFPLAPRWCLTSNDNLIKFSPMVSLQTIPATNFLGKKKKTVSEFAWTSRICYRMSAREA